MILSEMKIPKDCSECPSKDYCSSCIPHNVKRPKDCPIIAELPDNPTNGEMLMAIFPDTIIKYMGFNIVVVQIFPDVPIEQQFTVQWWNTKYGREVGTGNKIKR